MLWSTLKTCFISPPLFFHHPNRHIELFKLEDLMKLKGNKILRNVKTHWINMLSSTKWVMLYNPIVPKMVENNPYFMVVMVSFELLCDANLFTFFFLFVAFVANNLCTNEICTKARHFCLWLWYNHQNVSWTIIFTIQIMSQIMCLIFSKSTRICLIIITTQFAFEVEGSFIEPQRLKCWIFVFWFCGFHFLGYMFKCPWW